MMKTATFILSCVTAALACVTAAFSLVIFIKERR